MFERFKTWFSTRAPARHDNGPMASAEFMDINDPRLKEWMRGVVSGGGHEKALSHSAVYRSIDLISSAVAMTPQRVVQMIDGYAEERGEHPLTQRLAVSPSPWMSPYRLKRLMTARLLIHGRALARIVRVAGRVSAILPLREGEFRLVEPDSDGPVRYFLKTAGAGEVEVAAADVLHLRDLDLQGSASPSRVGWAADALGLATSARQAASGAYENGLRPGGGIKHPKALSPEARKNLAEGLQKFSGSKNAGKWMVLDEGMEPVTMPVSLADGRVNETLRQQDEALARIFGVPRPLMMMDETNWGSGVAELRLYFVQFTLTPFFTSWEEALSLALLTPAELARGYRIDCDERELLRGAMKDQAVYFSAALGSGGSPAWMTQNEVRRQLGQPPHPDGDRLNTGSGQAQPTPPTQEADAP